jgi:predicted GNAT family acetyltransferase
MAAWSGETPNGRRVGYVYTPPAHRRHGYATALVAYLSERILEDGCRFCFLYTDLDNPVSNSIYQQIGYRPVCDVMDWIIEEPEP